LVNGAGRKFRIVRGNCIVDLKMVSRRMAASIPSTRENSRWHHILRKSAPSAFVPVVKNLQRGDAQCRHRASLWDCPSIEVQISSLKLSIVCSDRPSVTSKQLSPLMEVTKKQLVPAGPS